MKLLVLLLCTFAYCLIAAAATDGDFIDQVDPIPILENKELRTKAFNCLMDQEPCGDLQLIKDNVPKLLKSKCGDCTANQKKKYDAALEKFKTEHNEMYKALMEKYAPELLH